MTPKRVLHIGMTYNPGGVESFVMNFYRNMDLEKIQFDFIDMYKGIAYKDEIHELGGNIFSISHFKRNPIKNYKSLLNLMKQQNYEVIHVHMLSAAYMLPLRAAQKSGVKTIIAHSHNSSKSPGILRDVLNRINRKSVFKNSTHFLACSKGAGEWLFVENQNLREIKIINNAIDVTNFSFNKKSRNKIRKSMNMDEKFVIGHVGRFEYQKNHEFLIDVFFQIHKRNSKAILLLIGEGKLKEKIQKKVSMLGMEQSVFFLGIRSDINELMQAMDIFLLPSHSEGLGIVAIEAQAAGLKTILSTEVAVEAAVTELVEFMSLSQSSEDWAKSILRYENGYSRRSFATEITKAGYDIKQESKTLESIYLNGNDII